jgi:hypothetical protein
MRLLLLLMACFLTESASANDGDKVSRADAAQHAVEQSSLTSPDSKPFHLRATLAENGEPGSDYQAKIEEYSSDSTPAKDRIRTVRVDEDTFQLTMPLSNGNLGLT